MIRVGSLIARMLRLTRARPRRKPVAIDMAAIDRAIAARKALRIAASAAARAGHETRRRKQLQRDPLMRGRTA